MPRILTLKINWGTNFGTLKKTMLALFDVITYFILFNGGNKTKFLGHDFQWATFEINLNHSAYYSDSVATEN